MTNCECGKPVFIKKTGECSTCYQRRWRREHPERTAEYQARYWSDPANRARAAEKARARYAAGAEARREARRDKRPVDVVLLEKTEQAFQSRERHLQRRREWNARNAGKRAEYRRTHGDPTKAERNTRAADNREARTGYRSAVSSRTRTPEQQARKAEYMKTWNDENRDRIRAQNAERQRRYRAQRKECNV